MKAALLLLLLLFAYPFFTGCDSRDPEPRVESPDTDTSGFMILRTTDGGLTWKEKIVAHTLKDPTVITYSAPHYLVLIEGHVIMSSDDGDSWDTSFTDYSLPVRALSASGENVVVFCAHYFYYSNTSGIAWTRASPSFGEADVKKINMYPYPNGYSFTDSALWKTIDGGQTWNQIQAPRKPRVTEFTDLGFSYADNTIIFTDTRGYIYRSHDNGTTWESKLIDPAEFGLTLIHIEGDGRTVNAFSKTGKNFHSDNLGDEWESVSNATMDPWGILGVARSDVGLFVVGPYGKVSYSTDAGKSWTGVSIPPSVSTATLSGIAFRDGLNGMIIGYH